MWKILVVVSLDQDHKWDLHIKWSFEKSISRNDLRDALQSWSFEMSIDPESYFWTFFKNVSDKTHRAEERT